MKVPTFRKYGITKSQFKNIENRFAKITHYLTHLLPIIIGIAGGMILYIAIFRNISPHGIPQYVQRVFVLGTVIIICTGISMLLFKGINYLYNSVYQKSSVNFKKAKNYSDERDKYESRKLRMDENYWLYLDGLSVENEILKLYTLMGYTLRSELAMRVNCSNYILGNEINNKIRLCCYFGKKIQNEDELNEITAGCPEIQTDEFHLVSVKGYDKKQLSKTGSSKVRIFAPAEVALMVYETESKKS